MLRVVFSASRSIQRLSAIGRRGCASASDHDGFAALAVQEDKPAPKELPDDQYPDWLWKITDPLPTKLDLIREADALYRKGGSHQYVIENMDPAKLKRLFQIHRKEKIRDSNALRKGGVVI